MKTLPVVLFSISKDKISLGEEISLEWKISGADAAHLNGREVPPFGSFVDKPTENSRYVLMVQEIECQVSYSVTVLVVQLPQISFEYKTLDRGYRLLWSTKYADNVTLNGVSTSYNGDLEVFPDKPTEYILVAEGEGGRVLEKLMIEPIGQVQQTFVAFTVETSLNGAVELQRAPRIEKFELSPREVKQGEPITLTWGTAFATEVYLNDGINSFPLDLSGTLVLNPLESTVYTLAAKGTNDTVISRLSITVTKESGLPSEIVTPHDRIPVLGRNYTHIPLLDGEWTDPLIWESRKVPVYGDSVFIPPHRNIRISNKEAGTKNLILGGELRFNPNVDTKLVVKNFLTLPESYLEVGTAAEPIQAGFRAIIEFADEPGESTMVVLQSGRYTGEETEKILQTSREPLRGDALLEIEKGD
jgi:hypothetical protein